MAAMHVNPELALNFLLVTSDLAHTGHLHSPLYGLDTVIGEINVTVVNASNASKLLVCGSWSTYTPTPTCSDCPVPL